MTVICHYPTVVSNNISKTNNKCLQNAAAVAMFQCKNCREGHVALSPRNLKEAYGG